jgi:hypothetical protein
VADAAELDVENTTMVILADVSRNKIAKGTQGFQLSLFEMASVSTPSVPEDVSSVLKELSAVFDACIASHVSASGQKARAVGT